MKTQLKNICKLCGRTCKRLAMHLKQFHHIDDVEQYYNQYVRVENEGCCLQCGKQCNFLGVMYGYHLYCSTKCSNNSEEVQKKKIDTCLINNGVEHPSQSDDIRNKQKSTCKEHSGFEFPGQCPQVKEKIKNTNLERYSVTSPMKCKTINEKAKKTSIDRYGGTGYSSPEINKKIAATTISRFGFDNVSKNLDMSNKIQQILDTKFGKKRELLIQKLHKTMKERYGYEHAMQVKEFLDKSCDTRFQKTGFRYSGQNPISKEKSKNTQFKKYGMLYCQTPDARKLYRETFLRDLSVQKNNGEPVFGRIGNLERPVLIELQKNCNYILSRPHLIGYLPDSYIFELNLVIEFDENWHTHSWCVKKDKIKNSDYNHYGIFCFRISQEDWQQNKEEVIENFVCVIKGLEAIQKLQVP